MIDTRVGEQAPMSPAELHRLIAAAARRHPSAGIAVAVIRKDLPVQFFSTGVADAVSGSPVDEHTIFRIGSLTKIITAVAVLQLRERGLIDLDAPANDYLREVRLVPTRPQFSPSTVRHLLTHTAGVGYWRRRSDLILHPGAGAGVTSRSALPLAEYYRPGLPVDVEPGTRWAYSNHGFAILGQIVEDVSGEPYDRYLHDHIFEPLGMRATGFAVAPGQRSRLATGYVLRARGLAAVTPRVVPTPAGGGLYSTAADLAHLVAAFLPGDGAYGVLTPDSIRTLFRPHFRPDPRVPGMALAVEPHVESGRLRYGKGGTVPGFLSALELAPEQGIGVLVLTNTGGLDNRGVAEPLAAALARRLLGLPEDPIRDDVVARPELWQGWCGWYAPDAGPVTNLFARVGMGAGLEVTVRRGRLVLRPLTPIPGLGAAMPLCPDDPVDPRVFRVALPGYDKTLQVVFTEDTPQRLLLELMSFAKRPDRQNPRRLAAGITAAGVAAAAIGRRRHRRRQRV